MLLNPPIGNVMTIGKIIYFVVYWLYLNKFLDNIGMSIKAHFTQSTPLTTYKRYNLSPLNTITLLKAYDIFTHSCASIFVVVVKLLLA